MQRFKLSLAVILFAPFLANADPILVVDSGTGHLLGATGVEVDGALYDVAFMGGTCADLFDGCDDVTDFVFQSDIAAGAASQALLDFVFLDVVAGNFDSIPQLTAGCTLGTSGLCAVLTPWGPADPGFVNQVLAFNVGSVDGDFVTPDLQGIDDVLGEAGITLGTWAVWSESIAVSEPGTLALLGMSLAGAALFRRRRAQNRSVMRSTGSGVWSSTTTVDVKSPTSS